LKPDLNDIFILGGLALAGYGLWLYKPWISFTVIGFALFILGVYAYRRKT